jgi:hypothetical protein
MSAGIAPGSLPSWADQMKALERVGDELLATWRPDGATEAETQDMNKLALSILATGYLCRVYTGPDRPQFMPLWNFAFNQGGPDPDYVYSTAEIDAAGTYRLSGFRGTSRFVEITQQSWDMLTPALLSTGGPVDNLDLDEVTLGEDGYFSVLVSAERPEGYDGDWWAMLPETRRLFVRKCACDWRNEVDASLAIARVDQPGADMAPEEIAQRFSELADWVVDMISFDMALIRFYREKHGVNTLLRSGVIDEMGGLPKQAYYDGMHEIADDECLIVETDLPETVRYWQILVGDDRFCTVDWVNRQSSLNDHQAHIDSDGRFRAVISRLDPGVPNWLDKADFPWGVIQIRWNQASSYPDPTVTKVALAEVRNHLPADTPVVTPDQRRQQLAARREAAQLRRIW